MPKIAKFQPNASPRGATTPFSSGPSESGLQGLGATVAGVGQAVQ